MFLIIEGLDRCGKSTLIKNLRKRYFDSPKTLSFHSSSPPLKAEDPEFWETQHYHHLFGEMICLSLERGFDVIADRFHLGAIVYGKLYRNQGPDTEITNIEEYWVNFLEDYPDQIALVLLTDDPEKIMERHDGDSIEENIEQYAQTAIEFESAFASSLIPNKLYINITDNGGFQNTYPTVEKFLNDIRG